MKYVIIIPARLKSRRLPGKPLLDICGKPMILRTYLRCLQVVKKNKIFVATDSNKIKDLCISKNINCIMTPKSCLTGTDRVFEASKKIKADIYINLQGDEPLFNPKDITKVIKHSLKHPKDIVTGYCKIKDNDEFRSLHIPKVVFSKSGNLLYASRAPIPLNKKNKFVKAYRQVCIYAFPKNILKKFNKPKKTPLEFIEDIEYLRFLEEDINIKCLMLSDRSIAVDTVSDLNKVKKIIKINEKIY